LDLYDDLSFSKKNCIDFYNSKYENFSFNCLFYLAILLRMIFYDDLSWFLYAYVYEIVQKNFWFNDLFYLDGFCDDLSFSKKLHWFL